MGYGDTVMYPVLCANLKRSRTAQRQAQRKGRPSSVEVRLIKCLNFVQAHHELYEFVARCLGNGLLCAPRTLLDGSTSAELLTEHMAHEGHANAIARGLDLS